MEHAAHSVTAQGIRCEYSEYHDVDAAVGDEAVISARIASVASCQLSAAEVMAFINRNLRRL
jgi:hypothetical protein